MSRAGEVAYDELNGRLLFQSSTDEATEIWVAELGADRMPTARQLTKSTGPGEANLSPSWSPDGQRIAFQHVSGADVSVYVMNADGTDRVLIAPQSAAPEWAPDGREVAVSHLRPGSRGIAIVDITDPSYPLRQVTRVPDDVPEEYPAWSPDGNRLAFTSHRTGESDVWVVGRDGSDLRNLTSHRGLDDSPSWSPDGRLIAFNSIRSGDGDIYVILPTGDDLHRLAAGEFFEGGAVWSPDGRYIVFTARTTPSTETGNLSIWIMRADGSGARMLFDSPGEDLQLSWTE